MTGYYDIYALDGHAWVEAYVDDIGWLELEPTAYYDGPAVDNETLSAEQINDYVERQLRLQEAMGESEISVEALLSAIWQQAYLLVTWVGAYLKLIFLNTWPWLTGIGATLLCLWILKPYLYPQWRAIQIKRRLQAAKSKSTAEAMACHLQAIDDLLRNAGYRRPAGLTIEQLLDRLVELDIHFQPERLSRQFNRMNYSDKKADHNLSHYTQLFDALYALGVSDLKRRICGLRSYD
jgi:hypothetical protein